MMLIEKEEVFMKGTGKEVMMIADGILMIIDLVMKKVIQATAMIRAVVMIHTQKKIDVKVVVRDFIAI